MKKFICLFMLSNVAFANAEAIKEKDQFCHSSKEYITVFRYLEAQKNFSLKKEEMMKIADVASKGCNGAARRFIEINDLLIKAGLETSDALKIAMKFTDKSDQTTDTFATIFKETFLKEYLDLDLKTSLEFSLKLAFDNENDPAMIKNDFQKIVKFCLDHKGLDLSGPKCSDLAAKVAGSGAKFKLEMAPTFLGHYDFLTDKEGADLATYKALEVSLKLIDAGPLSVVNFKDAYKFAISKSGLDLTKSEAINYAELMAQRSKLGSTLESGRK
ncbi:MAG: hypothetical protein ACXVLQ_06895 [Bacteriovorax sp.]